MLWCRVTENHQQRGGTYVRVDLGGMTIAIVASLVIVIGACGTVIGLDMAERQHEIETMAQVRATETTRERETRMLEYYVIEVDGKLENAGIVSSKESWATRKGKKP
jgi:hypothetical protein